MANDLRNVRLNLAILTVLCEVGKAGKCMGTHIGNRIVKAFEDSLQQLIEEQLEHNLALVIDGLADSLEACIANTRIGVLDVLENDLEDVADVGLALQVLGDLGECHNRSIFMPPVGIIVHAFDCILEYLEKCLAIDLVEDNIEGFHAVEDGLLVGVCPVIVFAVRKRIEPRFGDNLRDLDHLEEDDFEQNKEATVVLLVEGWELGRNVLENVDNLSLVGIA